MNRRRSEPALEKRFPAHDVGRHFIPVPVSLLLFGGQLRLTDGQFRALVALLAFKADERPPFPSDDSLASYLGRKPDEIRSLLVSLREAGFVRFVEVKHPTSGELVRAYDLDPLAEALEDAVTERAARKRALTRRHRKDE